MKRKTSSLFVRGEFITSVEETLSTERLSTNALKKKEKNYTPLHIAAINVCNKIGELLISKGADINAKDIIYQIIKNHF